MFHQLVGILHNDRSDLGHEEYQIVSKDVDNKWFSGHRNLTLFSDIIYKFILNQIQNI